MHFLHYAPTAQFEQGIFVPYNSLDEAESQATWELMHGADPENFVGVFQAQAPPSPKRGWTREELEGPGPRIPHLDPSERATVHDTKSLLERAREFAPELYERFHRDQEEFLLEQSRAIRNGLGNFENAVPGNAYSWCTGGTSTATPKALSAATAATVVYTLSGSANQHAITEIGVSFDGVTASAVPALVELVSSTHGGAGTPRAALAAGKQLRGWPAQTSQTTAADNYTAEPTTLLVNRKWFVTPNGGLFVVQFPLGREPTGIVTASTDGHAWGVRVTAPATVNCHAYIEWEE